MAHETLHVRPRGGGFGFPDERRGWAFPAQRVALSVSVSESESQVAQSCPTLCDPMDCSLPGSSIHGVFQARILEWVAISFSSRSSRPRDWTQVSRIAGRGFTVWATSPVTWVLNGILSASWDAIGWEREGAAQERRVPRAFGKDVGPCGHWYPRDASGVYNQEEATWAFGAGVSLLILEHSYRALGNHPGLLFLKITLFIFMYLFFCCAGSRNWAWAFF